MKKFELLEEATTADGTVLTLCRQDGAYAIRVDGVELMSTRRHNSKDRLAGLVCAPLRERAGVRVLVGGLGLGSILNAALRELGDDAEVVVVELVEAVIRWNQNPGYGLAAAAFDDPRVTLLHGDVAEVLAASPASFDGILLDVDNLAVALTNARNARIYRDAGIRSAAAALRPGGILAYWSADVDPIFADSLRRVGLAVEVSRARAHATAGPHHSLYVARPGG